MRSKAACCYFPTTVLFLDDNEGFLRELTKSLDSNLVYRLFSHSKDALQFLSQERDFNAQRHDYLYEWGVAERRVHTLTSIAKIHEEIYSSNKFREISVVVVDYDMPDTNGLEFCSEVKQLDQNFVKIIMLSGAADDQIAVQGFNDGIINRFIKKSSPLLAVELNNAIRALQHKYFCDLSRGMVQSLATNKDCALNDPIFIDLFEELVWNGNFVEYYLVDEFGSFLLLDIFGNLSWLTIKSDNVVDRYYQIAKNKDASETVRKSLAERKKIPFFFLQKDLDVQVDKWDSYLYAVQKLVGKNNEYYFALFRDNGVYNIQRERIASYKKYLDALGN